MKIKKRYIATFIFVAVMVLMVLIKNFRPGHEKTITIGCKSFAEQYIIANIISLLLEQDGYYVNERFGTGSMIARVGLITGQIDLYPEYTGTAWTLYMKHDEKINDPDILYERVKEEDFRENGLVWLDKSPINNTYALAIRKEDEKKFGSTLSTMTEYVNTHPEEEILFGVAHEFYKRPDGFKEMAKVYGLQLNNSYIRTMNTGLTFEAISRDQIDVAMVYSTDGKLSKYYLTLLEDDMRFFPIYNLCIVARDDVLKKYPDLTESLSPLFEVLDNETMLNLNYQVDVLGKPAKLVAHKFLMNKGLLKK